MTPTEHIPPTRGQPGFGRDEDLEKTRSVSRPAEADLSSDEHKSARKPTIHVSPDPDADHQS